MVMQSALVFRYFLQMKSLFEGDANSYCPKTAVILCLRGGDPSLENCLKSLTAQSYSNFELHLVFDDREDPARKIVETFQTNFHSNLKIKSHFLSHEIADTCSLKNQSIISVVSDADDSIEVFAFVDADGVVEQDWLESLVQPLSDAEVGASTGSRWFAPAESNLGSLFRQTWNAAALPQMSFYKIPWGGSLAIKRTTITKCNLLDLWINAFCEDTMMAGVLKKHGLKLAQVANVIVPNDESINLRVALAWVSRQLLTVRLHHQSWPLILIHAIFSFTCIWGAVVSLGVSYYRQEYSELNWLAVTLVAYFLGNIFLLRVIQRANGKVFQPRSDGRINPARPMSLGETFVASTITQVLYPVAVMKTTFMRKVMWRGIEYSITPAKRIEMTQYRPYRECESSARQEESIH